MPEPETKRNTANWWLAETLAVAKQHVTDPAEVLRKRFDFRAAVLDQIERFEPVLLEGATAAVLDTLKGKDGSR